MLQTGTAVLSTSLLLYLTTHCPLHRSHSVKYGAFHKAFRDYKHL